MTSPVEPADDEHAGQPVARDRVVVVGCGIAGMCTALALSRRGFEVTVLERDGAPPEGDADAAFYDWPRRGAAQFRHPHAFLGLMCNLLHDNYPDLFEAFERAGARRVGLAEMLPPELATRYRPEPGDEALFVLLCRRATIETVLRRYIGQQAGIHIVNDIHIDGLVAEAGAHGVPVVRGVRVRRDGIERYGPQIDAEVVVDASGRTSRFPRWLAALGVALEEENHDAEIVYYTRHYRLREGQSEPPRDGEDRASGDLGYIKYGVFPGDAGNFAVIVCVHDAETELREAITSGEAFDRICGHIPGLAPWVDPEVSEPTTQPFGIGDIRAVWRHYVAAGKPIALGLFAVGDAALRTNPLYGRGCSTGILHAHILAEVLSETTDPVERALRFDARTEDALRPIFTNSLSEDQGGIRRALAALRGEVIEEARGFKAWFAAAFGDALAAASRSNLRVLRGVLRSMHLLEKPGAFLEDRRTRLIVLAYMLRGRRKNARARRQRGPSRREMLQVLAAAKSSGQVRPSALRGSGRPSPAPAAVR